MRTMLLNEDCVVQCGPAITIKRPWCREAVWTRSVLMKADWDSMRTVLMKEDCVSKRGLRWWRKTVWFNMCCSMRTVFLTWKKRRIVWIKSVSLREDCVVQWGLCLWMKEEGDSVNKVCVVAWGREDCVVQWGLCSSQERRGGWCELSLCRCVRTALNDHCWFSEDCLVQRGMCDSMRNAFLVRAAWVRTVSLACKQR
jgi:hypothetical protein